MNINQRYIFSSDEKELNKNKKRFIINCECCDKQTLSWIITKCDHIICIHKAIENANYCPICNEYLNNYDYKTNSEICTSCFNYTIDNKFTDILKHNKCSHSICYNCYSNNKCNECNINNAPINKVRKHKHDNECSICLDEYNYDKITSLLCLHNFHNKCINNWFQKKGQPICPLCKNNMYELEQKQSRYIIT